MKIKTRTTLVMSKDETFPPGSIVELPTAEAKDLIARELATDPDGEAPVDGDEGKLERLTDALVELSLEEKPTTKVLAEAAGEKVSGKERDAAWEAYQAQLGD